MGPSAFPRTASWNTSLFGGPERTVGADIIYPALRNLRLIRPGQGPNPEIVAEALAALNAMLDSWKLESLVVGALLRKLYTLTVGDGDYTIGPGGDFVTEDRPSNIERASLVNLSNPATPQERPLRILALAEWQAIPIKTTQSSLPTDLYYDRNLSAGSGTIYLYPVPSAANQLALYLEQRLTGFETEKDPFEMLPGYLRALQWNLAVELGPRFENAVLSEASVKHAVESKAAVKRKNFRLLLLRVDSALLGPGVYDIRSG